MLKGFTNRVKVLFLLFILTGVLAVWTLAKKEAEGRPVYTAFAPIDTVDIVKVTFINKGQEHFITPKTSTKWMIDSKYEVRNDIVQLMKIGLARMEVKMPVSDELKAGVKAKLLQDGIQVQVTGEESSSGFRILTNENDENSSYYLKDADSEPYIVYVPGFTGDLTDLFKMQVDTWRNKALFRSMIGSIEEVTVTYQSAVKDGFKIEKKNRRYEVVDMPRADSTKLFTYLSQFQRVNVESYLVDKQRDSVDYLLKSKKPEVILQVIDMDPERSRTVQIYKATPGTTKLYARIVENGELVSLDPQAFFKILVRKQWFMDK